MFLNTGFLPKTVFYNMNRLFVKNSFLKVLKIMKKDRTNGKNESRNTSARTAENKKKAAKAGNAAAENSNKSGKAAKAATAANTAESTTKQRQQQHSSSHSSSKASHTHVHSIYFSEVPRRLNDTWCGQCWSGGPMGADFPKHKMFLDIFRLEWCVTATLKNQARSTGRTVNGEGGPRGAATHFADDRQEAKNRKQKATKKSSSLHQKKTKNT